MNDIAQSSPHRDSRGLDAKKDRLRKSAQKYKLNDGLGPHLYIKITLVYRTTFFRTETNSVRCWNGWDGSNVKSLIPICTEPVLKIELKF